MLSGEALLTHLGFVQKAEGEKLLSWSVETPQKDRFQVQLQIDSILEEAHGDF